MDNRKLELVTDFYEFTMSNGYFAKNMNNVNAYFDVFFREIPDGGGYVIFAGLEQIIEYIQNLHFDEEDIISWIGNSKVITIEDNIIKGGLGSIVLEALKKYHKPNELKMLGYPDEFIKQGTVEEIEKDYKLDIESILDMIRKWSNYE